MRALAIVGVTLGFRRLPMGYDLIDVDRIATSLKGLPIPARAEPETPSTPRTSSRTHLIPVRAAGRGDP